MFNRPARFWELRPSHFLYCDTQGGKIVKGIIEKFHWLKLGTPVFESEYTGVQVTLYPLHYRDSEFANRQKTNLEPGVNVPAPISDSTQTVPVKAVTSYSSDCDVTIVVPMRNEEANVAPMCAELQEVMDNELLRYEVIIINDGSTDRTADELNKATQHDPRFTVVELYRSFGQSAALSAGFDIARGKIIVPMDGDLQNDPHDIPRLIAQLETPPGYDIVSGWRKKRQDKPFTRRIPSLVANALVRRVTWCDEVHDFGCMIKAYRREVLSDVHLYGEMHRFLPALCQWRGARVSELVVNHRPRVAGETKYGLKRTIKVYSTC